MLVNLIPDLPLGLGALLWAAGHHPFGREG